MGKSLRHAIEINASSKSERNLDQREKFINAARELGCDEDESAFDEMVKKVAKAPPPRQEEKIKKRSRSKA